MFQEDNDDPIIDDPIVVVTKKRKVNYSKKNGNRKTSPMPFVILMAVCILIMLAFAIIKAKYTYNQDKQQLIDNITGRETNQYSNGEYDKKVGYYLYNGEIYYLYYYNDGEYKYTEAYLYSNSENENNGWVEQDDYLSETLVGYMLTNSDKVQLISETYSEDLIKYEIDQPKEYIAGYWYDRENEKIYGCYHREWYLYDGETQEYNKVDKDNSLVYKLEYYGFNYDELKKESGIDFVLMEGLDW